MSQRNYSHIQINSSRSEQNGDIFDIFYCLNNKVKISVHFFFSEESYQQ